MTILRHSNKESFVFMEPVIAYGDLHDYDTSYCQPVLARKGTAHERINTLLPMDALQMNTHSKSQAARDSRTETREASQPFYISSRQIHH